jgi:hypothetical protein
LAYILSSWFRTIYIFHLVEVKVLKWNKCNVFIIL